MPNAHAVLYRAGARALHWGMLRSKTRTLPPTFARRWAAVWDSARLTSALLWCAAVVTAVGCRRETTTETGPASNNDERVVLSGTFQAVTRPASGTAEIVRKGEAFELKLTGVSVKNRGPVHVYLVGLPAAPTTAAVDEIEMKYDMAELDPNQVEQRIELPSEPDSALRSVVLWDPKYSANLASAQLTPVR
jgi:hypothetical protein